MVFVPKVVMSNPLPPERMLSNQPGLPNGQGKHTLGALTKYKSQKTFVNHSFAIQKFVDLAFTVKSYFI